jgi:nicotinamidase-related amidase
MSSLIQTLSRRAFALSLSGLWLCGSGPFRMVMEASALSHSKENSTPRGEVTAMSVTTLDPLIALIVVDLQKGVLAHPCVHPVSTIVQNASSLASAFREHKLPVVLVNVAGTAPGRTEQALSKGPRPADWAELAPELDQHREDHRVTKQTWDAFTNTGLEAYLKGKGVTDVAIAGIATSIGVESTARLAYALGFNVTLATDAMTDRSPEAHHNSVSYIFPRLGETGTTQEIIRLVKARAV